MVQSKLSVALLSGLVVSVAAVQAADDSFSKAASTPLLPPEIPWQGKSVELIASPDHPWITPAEAAGFVTTPSYAETEAWLDRLVAASPLLAKTSIGTSPEGRSISLVAASLEGTADPDKLLATGRPIVLAHAGIHSGEIDGKDAGLMLLRDLTVAGTKRELLERAIFLFIPILSVDGHERSGPYNRVNQRGPAEMGWRTTSRNLNLNRDFAKLDAPETRALIAAIERYRPDLYLDLHVTDGADYQYDVTFGWNGPHAWSPAIAGWLDGSLEPALKSDLEAMGHVPGPLVFAADGRDPASGNYLFVSAGLRYSTGYAAARHLPAVLLENHSLKPYRQRVLGAYVFVESALRRAGEDAAALRRAVASDRARRPAEVPLAFRLGSEPPQKRPFLGVRSRVEKSAVTGGETVVWTGEPVTYETPFYVPNVPAKTADRPAAYWIPPAWSDVIERLRLHGVEMERLDEAREVEVEMLRLEDAAIEPEPFEGRARALASPVAERRREVFPPGSVRVPTDQPLGTLAVLLLEPDAPDSFFRWGFFLEVLSRTEYVESYVMEPMAAAMLAEDPELAAEYAAAIEGDPELAEPRARLAWLYARTPFFDPRWRLYPVAREPLPAEDAGGDAGGTLRPEE